MTRWTRLALAGGAVVLAVALFVVLRPDDDEDADSTPAAQTTTDDTATGETTTEDTETETEDTATEESPTTTDAENPNAPQRVVVVVRDGQPVGGVKRVDIERDAQVLLIVRSDVSDHMHLHGYDLLADVEPGRPGRIRFRADLRGRFDLELEDRVVLIAELRVR